jgi:CMP/dCMP kinase
VDGRPVDIITISREYGSGGSELARELGARLEWPVLDEALLHQVAERLRLDERTIEAMDEHPPSLLARIAAAMQVTPPELPVAPTDEGMLSPDAVADAARAIITEATATPPLVVVGHGSQCLLADRPGTLHLRLIAPIEVRLARVRARRACSPQEGVALARRIDAGRRDYVRRYYGRDLLDGLLYDLQINTGRMAISEAATLIVELVHARATAQTAAT